jgi:hypothetical protein
MEAASGPNTFGPASRIRPIFHSFVYRCKKVSIARGYDPRDYIATISGCGYRFIGRQTFCLQLEIGC